jgi:hypothetical protein
VPVVGVGTQEWGSIMASRRVGLVRRIALALTVVLVAGVLGFPASAEDAFVPDGPRTFRAEVSGPASGAYTLTLTNTATGNKTLGSANVTIPGFTIGGIPTLGDLQGRATLRDQTIEMRNLGLEPNRSASVTFSGAFGDVCAYQIGIEVRQANEFRGDGNTLSLFGPSPVLVDPSCAAVEQRLEFSVQPGDAITGEPVPGNTTAASWPTVQLVGGGAVGANAAIMLTILPAAVGDPTPKFVVDGALRGSVTVSMDSGSAEFDQLRITPSGVGYRLRATSGSLSVDSTSFNVYDDVCTPPEICSSTVDVPDTFSASATGTPGPDGGGLSLKVGGAAAGPGCAVPSGVKVSRIPPQGIVATGVGLTDKLLTLRLDRAWDKANADNDGVAHYQICAQSAEPTSEFSLFTDRFGNDVALGDWGYLPDCGTNGDRPPCVLSRTKSQGGFPVIHLRWGSKITLR